MMKKFLSDPRKCNSASSLSGCIHRYLSKVIISLLSKSEVVVFEKTLIGRFSRVKTQLAFNTSILLPKKQKKNLKLICKTRKKDNNNYEDKRLVGKILKMDENNQYGKDMTKPLPTDSTKRPRKRPTLGEFNLIIEGISDEDKTGHLFIVEIKFNFKKRRVKNTFFSMKSTHQYLKKRRLFPPLKDVYSNCYML